MINYSVNNKHRVINGAESCGFPLFKYFVSQLVAYDNQSNFNFSGYSPLCPFTELTFLLQSANGPIID